MLQFNSQMIRRNHIEKVARIDRHSLKFDKFDSKQPQRQSNSKKYDSKRQSDNTGEQCFKVTSSNKKYHQYKNWKDHNQNKNVSNQIKQAKIYAQPLRQFSTNENKPSNTLSRNYQYDLDQKVLQTRSGTERNYPSVINYDKQPKSVNNTANYESNRLSKNNDSEGKSPMLIGKYDNYNFQGINLENKLSQSPNKRRLSYQSTQKYQEKSYPYSSQCYTPLFQNVPSNSIEVQRRQRRPDLRNSAKATGKIVFYQNSFKSDKEQPTFRNYKITSFAEPKSYQQIQKMPQKAVGKSLTLGDNCQGGQQVSSKLKKISEFNDQINERIKNIIVCFESLKTKF